MNRQTRPALGGGWGAERGGRRNGIFEPHSAQPLWHRNRDSALPAVCCSPIPSQTHANLPALPPGRQHPAGTRQRGRGQGRGDGGGAPPLPARVPEPRGRDCAGGLQLPLFADVLGQRDSRACVGSGGSWRRACPAVCGGAQGCTFVHRAPPHVSSLWLPARSLTRSARSSCARWRACRCAWGGPPAGPPAAGSCGSALAKRACRAGAACCCLCIAL